MNVLVVEDSDIYREYLTRVLGNWGHNVVAVGEGHRGMEMLTVRGGPNVALVDWVLPDIEGTEICRAVRVADRDTYVYMLLLTARDRVEDVVRGLDAGADDYVVKPFNEAELRVRLRTAQRIVELQQRLLDVQAQLYQQATHDTLTGLLNRGAIMERLSRELARCDRDGGSLTIVMCDVDHFKNINDSHGHLVGDEVLRQLAERLGRVIRPYDVAGRYGGEEFLIILPNCGITEASVVARRVWSAVRDTPFEIMAGSLHVTMSAGVAGIVLSRNAGDAVRSPNAAILLKAADDALLRAKSEGRDQVKLVRQ